MGDVILGLDIGTASLGWALLEKNDHGNFSGVIASGVRIFEPGCEIDERTGKSATKAAERRAKRQTRRMLNRRRRRMARFRHCLQRCGLLPGEADFGRRIHEIDLAARDRVEKLKLPILPPSEILDHTLPYFLRAMALNYPLLPYELGRALYHLAQRRGFKSNRKADAGDKEAGKVKDAIRDLDAEMQEKGVATLGELFAGCDTSRRRIREQYTSRAMYEREFDLICERQRALLPESMAKELRNILFFQRPLKSARDLIGLCELEPKEKRCSWNRPEAQAFRVWQSINNLVLALPDGGERRLIEAERNILAAACLARREGLDRDGSLKFSTVRKLLNLPKMSRFTIESEGEKSIPGDKISLRLGSILGDRYFQAAPEFLEMLFQDLRSFCNEESLKRRLLKTYGFSESEAAALSEYVLPEGYCNLSLKAIRTLLPELEKGTAYATAVKQFYPEKFENSGRPLAVLPSHHVLRELAQITNPGVRRTLTQVRVVVNAVIRKYGRPDLIRVELARDLKNSAKERKKLIDQNYERRKSREVARKMIEDETGIQNPSSIDILKVQLAIECNWLCPYTGEAIGMDRLLQSSQFDIEHIIPYSRSMDDSFGNKTLCHWRANRSVKKNMTPFEAYGNDPDDYRNILDRVRKFQGPESLVRAKLRRFELEDVGELDGFAARELNDTRIAAKYAAKYLGLLYGGVIDSAGRRRIQTSTGKLSAVLRSALGFNGILGDGEKNRGDHRHHAVDAVAVALSDPALVAQIAAYFSDPEAKFKNIRFWDNLKKALTMNDWPQCFYDVRDSIDAILVSHHVRRRVRGSMHEETIYAPARPSEKGRTTRYCRKPLAGLSQKEVGNIVDHAVREAVLAKLAELGQPDPSRAFAGGRNLPVLRGRDRDGREIVIPVKSAKIRINLDTVTLGNEGDDRREVKLGNNHHMEIVDVVDSDGTVLAQNGYTVSIYEAYRRLKKGEPVICRTFPDVEYKRKECRQLFRMSIFRGDVIYTEEDDGSKGYRVIVGVPQSKQITYIDLNEARPRNEYKADKKLYSVMPNTLRKKVKGKYLITPAGEPRFNNA